MSRLTDVRADVVSLVDRAAVRDPSNPTEPQRFLLWKAEKGSGNVNQTGGEMPTDNTAALSKAEQERDDALAKNQEYQRRIDELEKAAAQNTDDGDDDDDAMAQVEKADLPETVKAALRKAEADRVALAKRAEDAERIAKNERDLREQREFIAKAETELSHIGSAQDTGLLLKSASEKLSKDEFEQLERVLKAANAQIDTGNLFVELGKGGVQENPAAREPYEAMLAKAEEIRKADPNVSQADALQKAAQLNPDLAREYGANVR